ncbi:MAG: hypothetical protein H6721_14835 [Sandaracinus sp.]|nr:hypothetical protein [Myxococcales bacterium]MCB9617398.1 hypothetical protein [Sandaracinus sp.]MCB9633388.1 hypothetical protein [Sandaracinus sp.]
MSDADTTRPDVPQLPLSRLREAEATQPRISLTSEAYRDEGQRFWHWLAERAPFARLFTRHVGGNDRED